MSREEGFHVFFFFNGTLIHSSQFRPQDNTVFVSNKRKLQHLKENESCNVSYNVQPHLCVGRECSLLCTFCNNYGKICCYPRSSTIRAFPFSPNSSNDSVAYDLVKNRLAESEAQAEARILEQSRCSFLSFVIAEFSSSSSACVSENLSFTSSLSS